MQQSRSTLKSFFQTGDSPTQSAVGTQFASILSTLATTAGLDNTGKLLMSQVPTSLLSGLTFQGLWNANSNNSPTLSTPTTALQGYYYKVSIAGTNTATGTSVNWNVGDWIISNG